MAWWDSLFGGGGTSDNNSENYVQDILDMISRFSYEPKYTGDMESGLWDLTQKLIGNFGIGGLPFALGTDTTGLYDSLTRGIKEQYLGTPGAGESGRIADIRAYYNNLGSPEQAMQAERLGNQDLNNSLIDAAAKLNENTKNRLTGILGMGAGLGQNLYNMNLGQHRFNAGLGAGAVGTGYELANQINKQNQSSLSDLFGGLGQMFQSIPWGNLFGSQTSGQIPSGSGNTNIYNNPYGQNYSNITKLIR